MTRMYLSLAYATLTVLLTPTLAAVPAGSLPRGASEPALSPDKRFVAYVLAVPGAKVSTGAGDADPDQLWLW